MSQHNLSRNLEYMLRFSGLRFIIVGVLAALVHFLSVILLVQSVHIVPLVANIFAFMIAFHVSYFGHYFFTFTGTTAFHRMAYFKLIMMQISFFIINEGLFYGFLSFNFAYPVAIFLVLLVMPIFSFVICKRWIFA